MAIKFSCWFFQRQLSIIRFTLNYPPIRNNLTYASLLSMLIETDYLNYPSIQKQSFICKSAIVLRRRDTKDPWNSWYFLGVNGRCWARPFIWRKKELPTPPKPPVTRKYSSVTRIHFYKEALSTLRNWSGWLGRLADWLIDWPTEKASRQTAIFCCILL